MDVKTFEAINCMIAADLSVKREKFIPEALKMWDDGGDGYFEDFLNKRVGELFLRYVRTN